MVCDGEVVCHWVIKSAGTANACDGATNRASSETRLRKGRMNDFFMVIISGLRERFDHSIINMVYLFSVRQKLIFC